MASQAGVNVQTLRYYERRGLLPAPARRESGYREYPSDAVRVVRFVKRAQELGFSLAEVETLLDLAAGGPDSCDLAQELATQKIGELDAKIAFEGGQALRVTVPLATAEDLDRALASDNRDSLSFEADDGRYTVALSKIVFVKRYAREATVGFGAAA